MLLGQWAQLKYHKEVDLNIDIIVVSTYTMYDNHNFYR
jgi:hypothetical protein